MFPSLLLQMWYMSRVLREHATTNLDVLGTRTCNKVLVAKKNFSLVE